MSALAFADILKGRRARLASPSDGLAGPSVLPPFSEKNYENLNKY
jgi:hypothetical protein